MTAPIRVVWATLNPEAIARGYWDQGLLEGLFDGDVWAVPGQHDWEHVLLDRPTDDELHAVTAAGAVLIVPARHHAAPEHAARLLRAVQAMPWCLLVLTGDEEGAFPVESFVDMDHVTVWVMTPQPDQDYGDATLIGSGWPPGIRDALRSAIDGPLDDGTLPETPKPLPWTFMGQVTHARREQCVDMLHQRADRDQAWLTETPGFTQGQPQDDYWSVLAEAKVAPCPSGPCSPDSFRLFEALEAGCIPIADDVTPDGRVHGFWARLFGALPFPVVEGDWDAHSATIDWLLDGWPANANRVFAWWQRQKRAMAWGLHLDVAALSGQWRAQATPAAAITAIITTSPSPKHPDTADLETTIESVSAQLPGCEIVLVFDGVRPELEHRRADYDEYTRRALWLANTRWTNVVPFVLDEWKHQAVATLMGLDEVRSRHIVFVEHDTPLTGDIDWAGIVALLDAGDLDVVRLHHETAIGAHHAHMMLDAAPLDDLPVPVVRTYQWSQRPHVAQLGWYRRILAQHFAPEARAMIEDVLHGVVATAWNDWGFAGWTRFRLGIYAPEGNIQRSLHLDSRRLVVGEESTGDPKGTMLFAYPGEAPPGAPAPGER